MSGARVSPVPPALRDPAHLIDPLFLDRWSPQAFDGSEVPDAFRIEATIAIGRQAPTNILPDRLRAREFPSDRD